MKSKVVVLSEIGEFKNGLNFNQNDYGIGYPIINVKQLYQSRFATIENLLGIKSDFAKKIDGYFVEKGDLLFVRGSMVPEGAGKLVMVNKFTHKTVFSGFIIRFRITNQKIANPLFLTYLLRSTKYREMFVRIASGSVHSNMNQEILGKIQVELPEISTQIQITKILDDIDTKIELLQNQNKILEQIIQSIFKSWFIDFDGVTEFEDSELGEIPKGWYIDKIGNVLQVKSGGTPSRQNSAFWNGDVLWIGSSKTRELRIVYADEKITELGKTKSSTIEVPIRTTVLAIIGNTIGEVSVTEINCCINQNIAAIFGNQNIPTEYIYPWINFKIFEIMAWKSGGAQASLNQNAIKQTEILIPDPNTMKKYFFIIKPIFDQIASNYFIIQNITKIRDYLLPKLMSGEIRV